MGNSCHSNKSGREGFPSDEEVINYPDFPDFDMLVKQGSTFLKHPTGEPPMTPEQAEPPQLQTPRTEPLTPASDDDFKSVRTLDSTIFPDTPGSLPPLVCLRDIPNWSPGPGLCDDSDAKSRVSCTEYPDSLESSPYFSSKCSSHDSSFSSPLSRVGRTTAWSRHPGGSFESTRSFEKQHWIWRGRSNPTICFTPVKTHVERQKKKKNIWTTPIVEHPQNLDDTPPTFPRLSC